MLGLGATGVLVGARVQNSISHWLEPVTLHDPTGLTAYLPGSPRFRIYSVTGDLPRSPVPYQLQVDGLVDRQLSLSLADLTTKLPQTMLTKDFQCVTGWRVESVPWVGVLLRDILDEAGVQPGAKALRFTSFDGTYTESLTLEQARRPDVIVATQMLGKPVTREHGGPVRLYVAPMYGYKSCKWLSGIEVTDDVEPGYWENLGYDVDGWIGRSNGRHDQPVH
jgi:DMSO/TMAO reductase YedYZ molybdopterin-dependent catalytic subunit